ncbi:hypothetical protein BX600DRAFT_477475, partial [Xylariales sp. PMI_506]
MFSQTTFLAVVAGCLALPILLLLLIVRRLCGTRMMLPRPPKPLPNLKDLLDREWTQRVWTFQEIMLGNELKMMCGHKVLLWEDFIRVLYVVDPAMREYQPQDYRVWHGLTIAWLEFPRTIMIK